MGCRSPAGQGTPGYRGTLAVGWGTADMVAAVVRGTPRDEEEEGGGSYSGGRKVAAGGRVLGVGHSPRGVRGAGDSWGRAGLENKKYIK